MTIPSALDTQLHPAFRSPAKAFWVAAAADGLDLVLVTTWRDPAIQAQLYAQGRTAPGKIVTWAKPGQSPHNVSRGGLPASCAIDVAPRHVLRLKDWAPKDPAWARIGQLAAGIDHLEWGGTWPGRKNDQPHLQLRGWRDHMEA